MDRRQFLASGTAAAAVASQLGACRPDAPSQAPAARPVFDLEEATIAQLQEHMASGVTSASITRQYLDRIAAVDHSGPSVNAVIEVNPEALAHAARLDEERKAAMVSNLLVVLCSDSRVTSVVNTGTLYS